MKQRADELLYLQGLAESREMAKRLIMAGKVVQLGPKPEQKIKVDKPGHKYPDDTLFELTGIERFVSRGAYKLLTALEHFTMDVKDMVCLDVGASTGGFTDCLLQHNARKVYAVDVGHNQLHERLVKDPRVINLEKVNVRTAPPSLIPEKIDLLVGDVSFISLTLILPPCMVWLKPMAKVLVLIKPQFELGPHQTDHGVVRSEALQQEAVDKIVQHATSELGLTLQGIVPSAIKGPKGNQEYMALFCKSDTEQSQTIA